MRRLPFALSAGLVVVSPAGALEPLAGPDNYAGVCAAIGPVWHAAEDLADEAWAGRDVIGPLARYTDALVALGFSPATRATVDADDLDTLLTAGEMAALVPVSPHPKGPGAPLFAALRDFAGKYRCRIEE